MKAIYFFAAFALTLNSCNQLPSAKNVKNSLPGVYTYDGKDEFSEASDTLTISTYNANANTYTIVKSTGFNRFVDNKKLPREYKTQEMVAVYDEKTMQLKDSKTGRLFSFPPGKNELLFGTATYRKLK